MLQTDPKLTAERYPKGKRTTKSAYPELEGRLRVRLVQLDGPLEQLSVDLAVVGHLHFRLMGTEAVQTRR